MTIRITRTIILSITTLAMISFFTVPLRADGNINRSSGQTVYVSIYSHIYSGIKARPFELSAVLSIRNVDPKNSLTITTVRYYDSEGNPIKDYLDQPVQLRALASIRYIIPEGDKTGGSGANFIVKWKSENKINAPIIESVMIGTRSGQGISFVSRGQVIGEE
jgi:hypothetical protein